MKRAESFIAQKKRRTGTVLAALLAGIAVLLAAVPARAADITQEPISLTVIPGSATQLDSLKEANVVVDLYQIATVDNLNPYHFTTIEKYASLKSQVEDPNVTNEQWREVAAKAFKHAVDNGLTPVLQEQPVNQPIILSSWGLYLVIARGSDISDYVRTLDDGSIGTIARNGKEQFTFQPELIAIPGKDPDEYGKINTSNPGDWQTEVTITLKPDQSERESAIEIVKTLSTYETKDPATFVFQIEAWLPGGPDDKKPENKVYSNTIALTFDESSPVLQSYVIDGLPVDAYVEVTEVYSGANYRLTTDETKTITVAADEIKQAVFDNTYDDKYHGGGSVVNLFEYDENKGWVNEKIFDESN